ncbi:MAG TPA: S9 family peptidase [Bryobacteraceae bacterium]|nr:S9 family peptidase [Bryobacteraceae bacterium]
MRFDRFLAILALACGAYAQKQPVTVEAAAAAPPPLHGPITWSPDGAHYVAIERGTLHLYETRSGKEREIVPLDKLEQLAVKTPPAAGYDWTNRHVAETTVQWFTDKRHILVSAGGDLFVIDVEKRSVDPLTQTSAAERDPKLSPDNRYVSFRRGSDLYVLEIASKTETRLTSNGSETLLNGQLDWVYPEELDLDTAHWWSPDSHSIAYLQFDTAREPLYPQVALAGPRGTLEPERYPRAGDPNPEVRLGIVPATGGETKWMDLGDPRGHLIARVAWSPSSREIFAERLNRVQNRMDLLAADPSTGAARTVIHEEDPQWINVAAEPHFLGSGDRFLWTSERSGFRHIYLYGADGKPIRQLTSGDWEVESIAGVDEATNTVFFLSTEDSPLGRQLYSIGLDGSGKQKLTKLPGTHEISLAPKAQFYIDDSSSLTAPPGSTLFSIDGKQLRVLHAAENEFEILPTEIVTVKTPDGATLFARMIKPAGFNPGRKYPAIVQVYGGPGVQSVLDKWEGPAWAQLMAQHGFVVWQLDNRGSSGRGHAFESPVFHNFGRTELEDQQEGIRHLLSLGFVDPARIGLYGWSYGGFMTLYTVTNAPGLIKAAVAGAPVTSWRNYDTIYTERYMGLPAENEDGYKTSSPLSKAASLGKTKLLILHNIEDDNVLFQNSLQMADALEQAGQQFSMVVYPQKTHHVSGPAYKQLLDQITTFFEDSLK